MIGGAMPRRSMNRRREIEAVARELTRAASLSLRQLGRYDPWLADGPCHAFGVAQAPK